MNIEMNKVTPLSRVATIIVFVGVVPALCFYIGLEYMLTTQMVEAADTGDVSVQYVSIDDCVE